MAQKTITELQLIDDVTADVNFPSDNGIQSYRATAEQIKDFILADGNVTLAKLDTDIFHGLTGVTPADDDYFPLIDTSASNLTKKGLVGTFVKSRYRSVTSYPDTVGASDELMKLSGTSGTVTLPTAVSIEGKRYKLVHAGTTQTNLYTLGTTSSQTIGGVAGGSYILCTNGESITVESDGANWLIVGRITNTDWASAGAMTITGSSSNPTKGNTPTTDDILWRRDGCDALFRYRFSNSTATGSAAGSGDYLFAIPSAVGTIDTARCTAYATVEGTGAFVKAYGVGIAHGGEGASNVDGIVVVYDSSKVRFFGQDAATLGCVNSGFYAINDAEAWYSLDFRVPMVNWRP